jgi:hypothetical protein
MYDLERALRVTALSDLSWLIPNATENVEKAGQGLKLDLSVFQPFMMQLPKVRAAALQQHKLCTCCKATRCRQNVCASDKYRHTLVHMQLL